MMTALGLWLDWRLFGNGRGMASPYFDDVFYWLDGRFYKWVGGFGAQLQSDEWRIPQPGTRRRLVGREFVVFQANRNLLRVSVSWQIVNLSRDLDAANAEIRQLHNNLKSWNHGQ